MSGLRLARAAALAAGVVLAAAAAREAVAAAPPVEIARNARVAEEHGGYATAVRVLRELRAVVPPDADLELALALDEARIGEADSALARLTTPLLAAALHDSLPVTRRHDYPWEREALWVNGRFDGWHWYVARARAELFAARGDWARAMDAARLAVSARPLAGREWHVLAVCALNAGRRDIGAAAAKRAIELDPSLPDAFHLAGLVAWSDGEKRAAEALLGRAIALDSTHTEAAIARVKLRLPGPPPRWPTELLTGARAAGLLTSPVGPKIEEFVQMETPATILARGVPAITEDVARQIGTVRLVLPILVDERGRALLHDLPWFEPARMPEAVVASIAASIPDWRFTPALRRGEPQRVWVAVEYTLNVP